MLMFGGLDGARKNDLFVFQLDPEKESLDYEGGKSSELMSNMTNFGDKSSGLGLRKSSNFDVLTDNRSTGITEPNLYLENMVKGKKPGKNVEETYSQLIGYYKL